MFQLYRYYDENNALLYVGISLSAVYRMSSHKHKSNWYAQAVTIKIENLPSRAAAEAAEKHAIKTEAPLHNKIHAPRQGPPPPPRKPIRKEVSYTVYGQDFDRLPEDWEINAARSRQRGIDKERKDREKLWLDKYGTLEGLVHRL